MYYRAVGKSFQQWFLRAGLLGGLDEWFVGEVGQGGLQKWDLLTGVWFLELEFKNCLNLQSLIATLVDMLQLCYWAPGPHNPLDILLLFRTALSNRDKWPTADAAIPQRVGSGHTENKHKCDDKKLQGRLPKQPKVFNFNELDFQVGSCEEGPSDEDDRWARRAGVVGSQWEVLWDRTN